MRNLSRGILILGAVAITTALYPVATTLARDAGRDYTRCIHTCNEIRAACDDRCRPECIAMFPDDNKKQNDCESACHDMCTNESQDCKLVCKGREPTPSEP